MSNPRHGGDLDKLYADCGYAVGSIGLAMMGRRDLEVSIEGLAVRGPQVEGGEFLMTVRGTDHEGAPVVGFHTATTLDELFRGVAGRLASGTMRWRPDEYRR